MDKKNVKQLLRRWRWASQSPCTADLQHMVTVLEYVLVYYSTNSMEIVCVGRDVQENHFGICRVGSGPVNLQVSMRPAGVAQLAQIQLRGRLCSLDLCGDF